MTLMIFKGTLIFIQSLLAAFQHRLKKTAWTGVVFVFVLALGLLALDYESGLRRWSTNAIHWLPIISVCYTLATILIVDLFWI